MSLTKEKRFLDCGNGIWRFVNGQARSLARISLYAPWRPQVTGSRKDCEGRGRLAEQANDALDKEVNSQEHLGMASEYC